MVNAALLNMMQRLTILTLLLMLTQALCASQGVENTQTDLVLRPQKIKEACFLLKQGQNVTFKFNSEFPLDFNLHFHQGDKVSYPLKFQSVATVTESFTAEVEANYCLMLTNTSLRKNKVTYFYTLSKD